ncbi:hypothetical protein D3C85_1874170 [compost metagenome]
MQFIEHGLQIVPALRVKKRHRLVENNNLWTHRQYTGNGHAAFLPVAQLEWRPPPQLVYAHCTKSIIGPLLHFRFRQS